MARGKFISLEGGEGAGKSTNIACIRDLLLEAGLSALVTREPGGTPFAEEIRALLLAPRDEQVCGDTELLLMFAARVQHVELVIKPALARGDWVISDRFTDATIAYQGAGRGIGTGRVQSLRALLLGGFAPDLTLLLDLPVESGMQRLAGRGAPDRFEREGRAFFDRVRGAYLELAQSEPHRFRLIDAARPLRDVQCAVREAVRAFLEQHGEEK